MTTKKIIREIEYADTVDDYSFGSAETKTSVLERKFTYDQAQHGTIGDFNNAMSDMAVQSISDVFDRKTIVLTDSDGGWFAVPGNRIVSAKAHVVDTLEV